MERLFEMEGQLLLWIREVFASPVMDKIMIFISSLANKGMLWIGIGIPIVQCRLAIKKILHVIAVTFTVCGNKLFRFFRF